MKIRVKGMLFALVAMPVIAVLLFAFSTSSSSDKLTGRPVPNFTFVDQEGNQRSRASLLGKVWVANFVFTSCSGTCPMLTQKMKKVVEEFGADPHFKAVSFSVDPENDSPKVLKKYASQYDANAANWLFLTGTRAELKDLIEDGFKVAMDGMSDTQTGVITHSEQFVVVDRHGTIRSYHDMDDSEKNRVALKRSIHKYLGKRF